MIKPGNVDIKWLKPYEKTEQRFSVVWKFDKSMLNQTFQLNQNSFLSVHLFQKLLSKKKNNNHAYAQLNQKFIR